MNILVTGGTGYIGSHICVELLESGYDVVVIDDFSNSKPDVLDSIYKITGKHVKFYEFNVLDEEKTEAVFKENKLDAVIHCAAFKAVGESVQKPIEYYTNNLMTTLVVAKMISRKIAIIWQIGKFGVIGVLNTLVDIGSLALITFLLRSSAGLDPKKELFFISGVAITIYSIYKAITFIIANINSYFWNKYWTFEQGAAKKTRAQFFQFFIVSLIGFIVNVLVASIVYKSLDILLPGTTDDQKGLLAAAAGSILGMAWNFIGYKFIVFKE